MVQMARHHRLHVHIVLIGAHALAIGTRRQPMRLTAGISSHLLQVFHRKLCARKASLRHLPLPAGRMRWLRRRYSHLLVFAISILPITDDSRSAEIKRSARENICYWQSKGKSLLIRRKQ